MEYFDSLSVNSEKLENLKNYLNFPGIQNLECNETPFQNESSDSCGLFVIYYIFHRMHNLDLHFNEFLCDIFEANTTLNEENVLKFCSEIINENS